MSEQLIQIVDEKDVPLRSGSMEEAQLEGLWHRIARVMVWDSETGRFLLQKIKQNPYYNGGKWNTTCSGHVEPQESYVDAAAREAMEEMHLVVQELKEVGRYKTEEVIENAGRVRKYFRHNVTYTSSVAASTLDISPNPDEVEDILWITMRDLVQMRNQEEPPMTAGLIRFVDQQISSMSKVKE